MEVDTVARKSEQLATVATDAEAASAATEDLALATEVVGLAATAAAELAAAAPVLAIIAAVALLGVGIYELVTHWKTVWSTIKAVVVDVWHGIDDNFIQPVMGF